MKAEILKMISKGDTDQKRCKKKEFEYLMSQETVRERRIDEHYFNQQIIRKIKKEVEDVIFKNLQRERVSPLRIEDGVMVQ
jgi:hypothetical protein